MSVYVCLSVQYVCLRLCVCLFFYVGEMYTENHVDSTTAVHRCIRRCSVMLVS